MDTMSSILSGYPCQARSQKECHGVTRFIDRKIHVHTSNDSGKPKAKEVNDFV